MASIIAILATVTMCAVGSMAKDNKCPDGLSPKSYDIAILKGTTDDACPNASKPGAFSMDCVNKWDAILEITRDGKTVFTLKPDGTSSSEPDFKPDDGAKMFFEALVATMRGSGILELERSQRTKH